MTPGQDRPDLETLLMDIIVHVKRYKLGRLQAISAAINGGALLTEAKNRLNHGDWLPYLGKAGLQPRTAQRWMKLSALGLTAEQVLDMGGIQAVLKKPTQPSPVSAVLAPTFADLEQNLAQAEAQLAQHRDPYYKALTARKRANRELKHARREARIKELYQNPPSQGGRVVNLNRLERDIVAQIKAEGLGGSLALVRRVLDKSTKEGTNGPLPNSP